MDAAGARALKERIDAHQAAKARRDDPKGTRPHLVAESRDPKRSDERIERPK